MMMLRKAAMFFSMSFRRKYLFLLTVAVSFYTFLLYRFYPQHASFGKPGNPVLLGKTDIKLISDIRFAIKLVNKYVPWENVCRHQAHQAKILCNWYDIPYRIFVGFKKNEYGKTEGHAWTMVDEVMITGFCRPSDYMVHSVFSKG